MIPLGPNRLNFDMIRHDIDAIIIIKSRFDEDIETIKSKIPGSIPIFIGYVEQDFSHVTGKERVLAFCGIGYPQKFFSSLEEHMHVVKTADFPDHHPYSDDDIVDLVDEATIVGAKLVTTEKDLARIPKRFHDFITAIPVKMKWHNQIEIESYLMQEKCMVA
jgi:tetraacyldisaccharide 4'-kinase